MTNPNTSPARQIAPPQGKPPLPNAPSQKPGRSSGKGRYNNPPKDIGAYTPQGW